MFWRLKSRASCLYHHQLSNMLSHPFIQNTSTSCPALPVPGSRAEMKRRLEKVAAKASQWLPSATSSGSGQECQWCDDHQDEYCTICRATSPRRPNPRLCRDCQDWDDFTHVVFCKGDEYAKIHPDAFSLRHNEFDKAAIPDSQKDYYDRDLQDLEYRPLSRLLSTAEKCIVCRCVADMLSSRHVQENNDARIAI